MQFAVVGSARCEAFPGATGHCPLCGGEFIARCGTINVWHWANRSRSDCDAWGEPESAWHLDWKNRFPRQWREVSMMPHRADVKSPRGVIELQTSSISTNQVAERESFYGEMVWLVDGRDFVLRLKDHGNYVTFRWKHPRKTWWFAEKPLFFDLGTEILKVHRIYPKIPCGGSGTFLTYDQFVAAFSRPKIGEALCEDCRMSFTRRWLVETGWYHYCTLDLDPGTLLCSNCYEARCAERIPDDPSLFDVYTPIEFATSL